MQSLQTLIEVIEKNKKIHISILDVGGIMSDEKLSLKLENIIHSKNFCNIAKSTKLGYKACLMCKAFSNKKAVTSGEIFCGHCVYGLCEVAIPVKISEKVVAIVYVGNAILDKNYTVNKIQSMCKHTGVSYENLESELKNCEVICGFNELKEVAEIVSDYLKMLYEKTPKNKLEMHWIVELMKKYADEKYSYNIMVKEFAVTHQMNEKYIGRLFKKQMGVSFKDYCNNLRLKEAENLLTNSSKKIIDIVFDCGFNNVTYFNRLFYKKNGVTPTQYRRRIKNS